jgi:hypothetical protein
MCQQIQFRPGEVTGARRGSASSWRNDPG